MSEYVSPRSNTHTLMLTRMSLLGLRIYTTRMNAVLHSCVLFLRKQIIHAKLAEYPRDVYWQSTLTNNCQRIHVNYLYYQPYFNILQGFLLVLSTWCCGTSLFPSVGSTNSRYFFPKTFASILIYFVILLFPPKL